MVVDEGIIPFKGHVKWRQHVKSKPHSTGLKYYAAADDSGYVYDFFLFADFRTCAEKAAGVPNPCSQQPQQVIHQFWNRICQDKKQGRILVADSYCGGMYLADELQKQKSRFVMACTSSRPSFLFGKKAGMQRSLAKHKWDWSTNENGSMIGVSFYDTGRINFLSNIKAHPCSHGNHSNK